MSRLRRITEGLLLLLAGYASLATSDESPWRVDERWVVANLFDGQTAVANDVEIELRLGLADFRPLEGESSEEDVRAQAETALSLLLLRTVDDSARVALVSEIGEETTVVRPLEPLEQDTQYEFNATGAVQNAVTARPYPDVIEFTTQAGPQVTGIWRVDDTLMISFSEAMNPASLELSAESVDLLWDSPDGLRSVVSDRNLADYAWEADKFLFRVAPIDPEQALWVKVSRHLVGVAGAPLDGDGDGIPGEVEDDFLELIDPQDLERCLSADDRPEPCSEEDW